MMAEQPVRRTSGMAVAALVCGICGLLFGWIPGIGFLLQILGIIFGGVGIGQTGRDPNVGGRGMAITGLVLGILGIILWIIVFVTVGFMFWTWFESVPYYY
jgi:hypothetical protein